MQIVHFSWLLDLSAAGNLLLIVGILLSETLSTLGGNGELRSIVLVVALHIIMHCIEQVRNKRENAARLLFFLPTSIKPHVG